MSPHSRVEGCVWRFFIKLSRGSPPQIGVGSNATFGSVGLPNHLQGELNDPGPRRQRLLQTAPAARRAVLIEYLGVT